GVYLSGALVGERWQIGTVELEVSEPRLPCFKLGVRMDDPAFVRTFAQARRPGTYLRIVTEGTLQRGDAVHVRSRPDHDLTVRDIFEIYLFRKDQAARLLEVSGVSQGWRDWAAKHA
ncbi:MAG: MOSC domain-containing protein, partial [Myxococcota bacterium]